MGEELAPGEGTHSEEVAAPELDRSQAFSSLIPTGGECFSVNLHEV